MVEKELEAQSIQNRKDLNKAQEIFKNGEQTVDAIIQAGSMLMKAGAEVYRVEETMLILGNSTPNVSECIPYVTSTGVMCSIVYEGITFTRIARIKSQSRNISIINEINSLSREQVVKHYEATVLIERLNEIEKGKIYSDFYKAILGAVGAGGFAIFFSGNVYDVISVVFIGLIVRFGTVWMDRININSFLSNTFLSAVAGTASVLIAYYYSVTNQDTLIISSIMLLVPGLAIMNAIRDIMMGEYLSGTASLVQAMFVAAAIAIGIAFSLYFATFLTGL